MIASRSLAIRSNALASNRCARSPGKTTLSRTTTRASGRSRNERRSTQLSSADSNETLTTSLHQRSATLGQCSAIGYGCDFARCTLPARCLCALHGDTRHLAARFAHWLHCNAPMVLRLQVLNRDSKTLGRTSCCLRRRFLPSVHLPTCARHRVSCVRASNSTRESTCETARAN